jgi:hypothetical protein
MYTKYQSIKDDKIGLFRVDFITSKHCEVLHTQCRALDEVHETKKSKKEMRLFEDLQYPRNSELTFITLLLYPYSILVNYQHTSAIRGASSSSVVTCVISAKFFVRPHASPSGVSQGHSIPHCIIERKEHLEKKQKNT